jgi:uncharacterized protein (DUF1778 family)
VKEKEDSPWLRPLVLTPECAARVLDLIENPRPPTPALKKLFEPDTENEED